MRTILLVEDDQTSHEMLSLRLQLNGYETLHAHDGREGLRVANQASPDIILLDMNLPEMDGWTVAKSLKGAASTAGIPIIGVSAHAMPGDRERALEAGCDEYETKPVDWARLHPKIEKLLSSSAT